MGLNLWVWAGLSSGSSPVRDDVDSLFIVGIGGQWGCVLVCVCVCDVCVAFGHICLWLVSRNGQ